MWGEQDDGLTMGNNFFLSERDLQHSTIISPFEVYLDEKEAVYKVALVSAE
jgi:hypothetical protein